MRNNNNNNNNNSEHMMIFFNNLCEKKYMSFLFSDQKYVNDNCTDSPVKRTHILDRGLGFNICLLRN